MCVANFQNFLKHPLTFAFDTDKNSNKQSGWNILLDWTPCNKKNTYKEERKRGVFQITHALSIHSYGLMDISATIQANKSFFIRNTNKDLKTIMMSVPIIYFDYNILEYIKNEVLRNFMAQIMMFCHW